MEIKQERIVRRTIIATNWNLLNMKLANILQNIVLQDTKKKKNDENTIMQNHSFFFLSKNVDLLDCEKGEVSQHI